MLSPKGSYSFSFVFIGMVPKPAFCFLNVRCDTASFPMRVRASAQGLTLWGLLGKGLPVHFPTLLLRWQWEPLWAIPSGSLPLVLHPTAQSPKASTFLCLEIHDAIKQKIVGSKGPVMVRNGKWKQHHSYLVLLSTRLRRPCSFIHFLWVCCSHFCVF